MLRNLVRDYVLQVERDAVVPARGVAERVGHEDCAWPVREGGAGGAGVRLTREGGGKLRDCLLEETTRTYIDDWALHPEKRTKGEDIFERFVIDRLYYLFFYLLLTLRSTCKRGQTLRIPGAPCHKRRRRGSRG